MKNKNSFTKQDIFFMILAKKIAMRSNDPSVKVGAVITNLDGEIVATGYNHFPNGIAETPERWERPLKGDYVEHAERNAIYAACSRGIPTLGCTIYVNYDACIECARAIIQSGIKKVVTYRFPETMKQKWKDMSVTVHSMYAEAGVEVVFLPERV